MNDGIGLLGDTPGRNYIAKLRLFNAFAARELRNAVELLDVQNGMCVIDAGCGTGETLQLLAEAAGPKGQAIGLDLATAHLYAAQETGSRDALVLQADIRHMPFRCRSVDRIWCANTIHHLRDPVAGLRQLTALLRPGGRIGLAQSALLPEMVFAWDARLERKVNSAVRQYYQQRYGANERELAAVRNLVGLIRSSTLDEVTAHTLVIERLAPLMPADRDYLLEAIFRNTWGERLRPYLDAADFAQLQRWCDPLDPEFALARSDFHYLQTLTLVCGRLACA